MRTGEVDVNCRGGRNESAHQARRRLHAPGPSKCARQLRMPSKQSPSSRPPSTRNASRPLLAVPCLRVPLSSPSQERCPWRGTIHRWARSCRTCRGRACCSPCRPSGSRDARCGAYGRPGYHGACWILSVESSIVTRKPSIPGQAQHSESSSSASQSIKPSSNSTIVETSGEQERSAEVVEASSAARRKKRVSQ